MVLDTSAIIAILRLEPEAQAFADVIEADGHRAMSAATLVETSMVAEGRAGSAGIAEVDLFISRMEPTISAVDRAQAEAARRAWRRYGKGKHPAGLNLGDCFSYALSVTTGEPLLFKGDDFAQTDVVPAV